MLDILALGLSGGRDPSVTLYPDLMRKSSAHYSLQKPAKQNPLSESLGFRETNTASCPGTNCSLLEPNTVDSTIIVSMKVTLSVLVTGIHVIDWYNLRPLMLCIVKWYIATKSQMQYLLYCISRLITAVRYVFRLIRHSTMHVYTMQYSTISKYYTTWPGNRVVILPAPSGTPPRSELLSYHSKAVVYETKGVADLYNIST